MRDQVQIATKFGVRHEGRTVVTDSNPDGIRRCVEVSLKRLGTDHIDLYYQHRIDPKVSAEEVAGAVAQLIAGGKILHWGISEATEEYLRRAHAVCPVACVQERIAAQEQSICAPGSRDTRVSKPPRFSTYRLLEPTGRHSAAPTCTCDIACASRCPT